MWCGGIIHAETSEPASLAAIRIRIERFANEPVDQKSAGASHFSQIGSEAGFTRKQMWPRLRNAMTETAFFAFAG